MDLEQQIIEKYLNDMDGLNKILHKAAVKKYNLDGLWFYEQDEIFDGYLSWMPIIPLTGCSFNEPAKIISPEKLEKALKFDRSIYFEETQKYYFNLDDLLYDHHLLSLSLPT